MRPHLSNQFFLNTINDWENRNVKNVSSLYKFTKFLRRHKSWLYYFQKENIISNSLLMVLEELDRRAEIINYLCIYWVVSFRENACHLEGRCYYNIKVTVNVNKLSTIFSQSIDITYHTYMEWRWRGKLVSKPSFERTSL